MSTRVPLSILPNSLDITSNPLKSIQNQDKENVSFVNNNNKQSLLSTSKKRPLLEVDKKQNFIIFEDKNPLKKLKTSESKSENLEMKERVDSLQKQNEQLQNELSKVRNENVQLVQQNQKLKSRLKQLDKFEEENEELKQSLASAESDKKYFSYLYDIAKSDLEDYESKDLHPCDANKDYE